MASSEVASSRRALLLVWYGPGMLPTYCLPAQDVRTDLLRPSPRSGAHNFVSEYDVSVGDLVVPRSAQLFHDPPPPLQALDGHWTFTWDDGLSWFEEALEDVRQDLFVSSTTVSRCPYKGTASYWSVRIGDVLHPDVAWTYREPVPECPRITGLVCFFNEAVDLIIDGVPQERPRTPWSS